MARTPLLVLVFALCAAVIGCDDGPTSPTDVIGDTWELISLRETGADAVNVPDPSRYRVTFEDNGRLGVISDCNTCGGTYVLSGSTLTVTPLNCTRVFCGEGSLDVRFAGMLERAQTLIIDDDELTVLSSAGTLRFRAR